MTPSPQKFSSLLFGAITSPIETLQAQLSLPTHLVQLGTNLAGSLASRGARLQKPFFPLVTTAYYTPAVVLLIAIK